MTDYAQIHILFGWGGILLGALSGAVLGLFFHLDEWAGGYGSYRRRLLRLGHIAFFGLGFLNLLFAFTLPKIELTEFSCRVASLGFLSGALTMPLCCFLAAWRKPFRLLFPLPVTSIFAGILPILSAGVSP